MLVISTFPESNKIKIRYNGMENNNKLLGGSRFLLRNIGIYVIPYYVIAVLVRMLKHRGWERTVDFIRYGENYVIR